MTYMVLLQRGQYFTPKVQYICLTPDFWHSCPWLSEFKLDVVMIDHQADVRGSGSRTPSSRMQAR